MNGLLRLWRRSYRYSRLVFPLLIVMWFWSWSKSSVLPAPGGLDLDFRAQPVQEMTPVPDFKFEWRKLTYLVFPMANYYVRGLVVSHNNVGGITDAYHSSDAVDLKDLCLVWGKNAQSGVYQKMQFWSEPWTCNYRTKDSGIAFNATELSNNHLLAGTEKIADDIRATRIGDQVEISGYLVNYASERHPDQLRKTSLTRTDTGDGACEVVFVTDYRIVKKANSLWRSVMHSAARGLVAMGIFLLLSWTVLPYLEYKNGL